MMNKITTAEEMAAVAQEFMQRSKLRGREVDAYGQVYNWLQDIRDHQYLVILPEPEVEVPPLPVESLDVVESEEVIDIDTNIQLRD